MRERHQRDKSFDTGRQAVNPSNLSGSFRSQHSALRGFHPHNTLDATHCRVVKKQPSLWSLLCYFRGLQTSKHSKIRSRARIPTNANLKALQNHSQTGSSGTLNQIKSGVQEGPLGRGATGLSAAPFCHQQRGRAQSSEDPE